jgi:hypothetical protein
MDTERASRLRQEISRLMGQRNALEKRLLRRRHMLRASYVVRYLGTKEAKRRTPADYLSFRKGGRTVLRYVLPAERISVKAKAQAWGQYVRWIAEWVKITRDLEKAWRALGEAQAEVADGDNKL